MNEKTTWIGERAHPRFEKVWTAVSDNGLIAVSLWPDRAKFEQEVIRLAGRRPVYDVERVTAVLDQLAEYFAGQRRAFTVPPDWSVLPAFQQAALRAVYEIPYGRYLTYGDIAKHIGQPQAVRAVGRANATNPMPIVIPCHRVLGRDGKLHGYGGPGGLETKAWLLQLEGAWLL